MAKAYTPRVHSELIRIYRFELDAMKRAYAQGRADGSAVASTWIQELRQELRRAIAKERRWARMWGERSARYALYPCASMHCARISADRAATARALSSMRDELTDALRYLRVEAAAERRARLRAEWPTARGRAHA